MSEVVYFLFLHKVCYPFLLVCLCLSLLLLSFLLCCFVKIQVLSLNHHLYLPRGNLFSILFLIELLEFHLSPSEILRSKFPDPSLLYLGYLSLSCPMGCTGYFFECCEIFLLISPFPLMERFGVDTKNVLQFFVHSLHHSCGKK